MRAHHDERLTQLDLIGAALSRAAAAGCAGVVAVACAQLTEPAPSRGDNAPAEAAPPPPAPAAPAETVVVADNAALGARPSEQIEASHILVSYQGAARAKPTV